MIVSLFLSLSRRIRAWTASVLHKKKKALRMNTPTSAMLIKKGDKSVFKFLNS
jgi:hypothetical protein